MLNLNQILAYYPESYQKDPAQCLREYLQYKILKYTFASPFGEKLRFIGWTALRIVYGNPRFSEDIDFDNDGTLTFEDFEQLSRDIQKKLEAEWLHVYIRTIKKWAFHCHINIPEILYDNHLAPMKTQKILIQIDTVAQWVQSTPKPLFLSAFDVQTDIITHTPETLLAQKCATAFSRKRMKGRDFFDIVFLLWKTKKVDYHYLEQKCNISAPQELKSYLLEQSKNVNFVALHKDVAPFLTDPTTQSVLKFPQIIEQTVFE